MTKYSRFSVVFVIVTLLAAACQPQPTETVVVPTLLVLPTVTETFTPSPTFTPSNTFTPSHTYTPSDTPPPPTATHTPTSTNTATPLPTVPTATFTPSLTFTLTPSRTLRPTLTPTADPSLSVTPGADSTLQQILVVTAAPTLTIPPIVTSSSGVVTATTAPPVISSFTTNAQSVTSNATLIVNWSASGDIAQLNVVSQANVVLQSYPVPVIGSYSIIPGQTFGNQISIQLTVQRGMEIATRSIPITIVCDEFWYFGNQFALPESSCPTGPERRFDAQFQAFERGFMIYVSLEGVNRVYAASTDNTYLAVTSGWDGTTLNPEVPEGCTGPIEGVFNWVYWNTLGVGGLPWESSFGCPTGLYYSGQQTIQYEGIGDLNSPFYVDTPDNALYRFSGGDAGIYVRVR